MPPRLIALWRAVRVAQHIAYGLILAIGYPRLSPALRQRILQRWSAGLLHILNVRIEHEGQAAPHSGLIVCNHISWLDIFVLNAVVPMRFVAKADVRRWPLIGWLCARAGTLFIQRGNARAAARMNTLLCDLLRQQQCLAVFPEGTTTDGAQVAHFHASLLQPAIDAGVALHPLALRYEDTDGLRSVAAAYHADISFGSSLWTLLNTPHVYVRVHVGAAIASQGQERRILAQQAYTRIAAVVTAAESHKLHAPLTGAQQTETNLHASTT